MSINLNQISPEHHKQVDRCLPTHYSLLITHLPRMQTNNQTADPEGDDVADKIVQEQTSLIRLRILLQRLSWPQKIAVAQIACNQMGSRQPVQLVTIHPFGATFDDHLQAASILMSALPAETLAGIAIEILENPND